MFSSRILGEIWDPQILEGTVWGVSDLFVSLHNIYTSGGGGRRGRTTKGAFFSF